MPGTHWVSEPMPHHSPVTSTAVGRVARSTHRGAVLAGVLAVALLVLSGVIVWTELREPAPWDPLAQYPPQAVLTPEVRLGGMVMVVGTKCADEHVTVRGVLSWQAIDPPGAVITVGRGVAEREVGCTRTRYSNPIPPEVEEVIRDQHAAGIVAPVWRITGTETPFDDDRVGVSRTFTTDNFTVLP